MIFFGKAGKSFVKEVTMLYQGHADNLALYSVALIACSFMQPSLLQNSYTHSKAKDHSTCLSRRLQL